MADVVHIIITQKNRRHYYTIAIKWNATKIKIPNQHLMVEVSWSLFHTREISSEKFRVIDRLCFRSDFPSPFRFDWMNVSFELFTIWFDLRLRLICVCVTQIDTLNFQPGKDLSGRCVFQFFVKLHTKYVTGAKYCYYCGGVSFEGRWRNCDDFVEEIVNCGWYQGNFKDF